MRNLSILVNFENMLTPLL